MLIIRVRPHRKSAKDGQREAMRITYYVTQLQCNRVHSKTLQLNSCNRLSNRITYLRNCYASAFTNTKQDPR